MAFKLLPSGKACGILVFTVLCGSMGFAADPSPFEAYFDLTASHLEINEGDIVEFDIVNKRYVNSSGTVFDLEADMSAVEWDFGGGGGALDQAFGLYNIKHRFFQDSHEAYVVKATHQNTTKQVSIKVNNVAPVLHSASVTQPAVKGVPLVFQAGATDPADVLEYRWTFGDGATKTGQAVTHTYASDGIKDISIEVSDGKEHSEVTFKVRVGEIPFRPGMLDVDGDITVGRAEIDGVILVGSTANPTDPSAGGVCQLRLEMRSSEYNTGLTLTALLDPGLAPGHYRIGKTSEWDGQHKNDASALGTFFADYSAPKDQARRSFGGTMVSGPFWSDGGRVTITKFDGEMLELNFEAFLTENIPEMYFPRKVTVVGGLSTSVPSVATGPGIGDVDNVTDNPGIDGAGIDVEGLNLSNTGLNVKAYLCGGEEPAEFELVSSFPAANATNADYVDAGIKVMFTQAVDPDSLMDNAFVEIRGVAEPIKLHGMWVVSPKNKKMINFIPQATLLPGLIHCVRLNAGAEGIRSLGGNTLTGSSLNGFSQAMAPACNFADAADDPADTRRFAFSTQVELTSVWVDFYQASLAGGGVKLIPQKPTVARVYPYWRSRYESIHDSAQVTEFSATVFITRDRKALFPEQTTTIKRPDLFTADERRRAENSVNFIGLAPSVEDTEAEAPAFAVVKPLPNNNALLRTVYPGAISEVNLWGDKNLSKFHVQLIFVQGVCATGVPPEECGWDEPIMPYFFEQLRDDVATAFGFANTNMPVTIVSSLGLEVNVVPCSGGSQEDICNDGGVIMMQLPGSVDTPAENVADRVAQLVAEYDIGPYPTPVHATIVFAAPGLLPDPDNEPIHLYIYSYPRSPVILAQVDRVRPGELAQFLVNSVLSENGCQHYRPTENCDETPVEADHPWTVQGLRFTQHESGVVSEYQYFNKHPGEGNEESDRLYPLMRYSLNEGSHVRDSFISAYNYKRLFAPIANRNRIWKEDNPEGPD